MMKKSNTTVEAPVEKSTVEVVENTIIPKVITVEGKLQDITNEAHLFQKLPKGKYILEYRDSRLDVIMPLPVFWDGEQLFA